MNKPGVRLQVPLRIHASEEETLCTISVRRRVDCLGRHHSSSEGALRSIVGTLQTIPTGTLPLSRDLPEATTMPNARQHLNSSQNCLSSLESEQSNQSSSPSGSRADRVLVEIVLL